MRSHSAHHSELYDENRYPRFVSDRLWRKVFLDIPELILITDRQGRIICANKAFLETVSADAEQTALADIYQFMPDLPDFAALSEPAITKSELSVGSKKSIPVEVSITPINISKKVFFAIVGRSIKDALKEQESLRLRVEELIHTNATLAQLAEIDPLTGLLNRRGLERVLQREESLSQRQCLPLCCALLDVDDFKTINDRYGHAVGDIVLKNIAERVKQTLRGYDYLARVGGDEFIVLMPSTGADQATTVMTRVLNKISTQPVLASNTSISVAASCGVSIVSASERSIADLLSLTRLALKRSKVEGKNRVSVAENQVAGGELQSGLPESGRCSSQTHFCQQISLEAS